MSSLQIQRYTPKQYLEIERKADFRSEYVNGEMLAMAGASREHNRITLNLGSALTEKLRATPCEPFTTDMRVQISATRYTYPDVVAACEPEFQDSSLDVLINPLVIIEVLSPTTESDDRGWKFAHYRRSPTLTDYIMVAQNRPSVEHYSRHGQDLWTLREYTSLSDILLLESLSCEIRLEDIYERITFPAESEESGEMQGSDSQ